jgi:hypothetical protein
MTSRTRAAVMSPRTKFRPAVDDRRTVAITERGQRKAEGRLREFYDAHLKG